VGLTPKQVTLVEIRDQVPGMATSSKATLPPQKVDIWGAIKHQDKCIHAFEVLIKAAVSAMQTLVDMNILCRYKHRRRDSTLGAHITLVPHHHKKGLRGWMPFEKQRNLQKSHLGAEIRA
jgi:hypothetical protein